MAGVRKIFAAGAARLKQPAQSSELAGNFRRLERYAERYNQVRERQILNISRTGNMAVIVAYMRKKQFHEDMLHLSYGSAHIRPEHRSRRWEAHFPLGKLNHGAIDLFFRQTAPYELRAGMGF